MSLTSCLLRYLQEVGYSDAVLDVKSQRVRVLLGLTGEPGDGPGDAVNGTPPSSPEDRADRPDPAVVLEAFKFIETAAAEFSDEDEEEDEEARDRTVPDRAATRRKPSSTSSSSSTSDLSDDPDTEEALKGFDFLTDPDQTDGPPEFRTSKEGGGWEEERRPGGELGWDVDQGLIAQLKEQYKKERRGKKGVKRPNRSKLQDMLANLRDTEELPPVPAAAAPPLRPGAPRLSEPDPGRPEDGSSASAVPSAAAGTPDPQTLWFPQSPPAFLPSTGSPSSWGGRTRRSPASWGWASWASWETGGADGRQRGGEPGVRATWTRSAAWPSTAGAGSGHRVRGPNAAAVEPAEDGAGQEVCRSGRGAHLHLQSSQRRRPLRHHERQRRAVLQRRRGRNHPELEHPQPQRRPYDSYEPSVLRGALSGHTDAVWGVVYSAAHHRLLSCSADGTVRLWNAADTAPSLAVFNEGGELGAPTSVDLVSSDPAYMVASFSSGHMGLFNMETQQLVLKLESAGEPDAPCKINKVLSHPALPISITAQEDRHIRFFDNNTGKLIHSMVAHLDSVTCLAVDPNGLYLMSGSHDCSIRLWNMESRTCIQEFTAHRKKFEESIHDVAFHPTKCYIGSAGADALAKVFV
ncbi:hypothetical protein OJAV_G00012120 [Oryzias javanicus]|uniref:Uncharacterized protein n=1 Tax=Oryzias javanicus TaxID=123683 RepID=A0A3S2MIJ2_ORYJA|nr:hypothetical protein OJAV_G00012120 [Oryzias javanicus]